MAAKEFTIDIPWIPPGRDRDLYLFCQWNETYIPPMMGGPAWTCNSVTQDSQSYYFDISVIPEWAYITKIRFVPSRYYNRARTYLGSEWYLSSLGGGVSPAETNINKDLCDALNALDTFNVPDFHIIGLYKGATSPVECVAGAASGTTTVTYWNRCTYTDMHLLVTYECASFGELEYDPIYFGDIQNLTVKRASDKTFPNIITHDINWYMADDISTLVTHHLEQNVLLDDLDVPFDWLDAIPESTAGPAICSIQTYLDGEDVGFRDLNFTCKLRDEDALPSITPTFTAINDGFESCTDFYQYYSKALINAGAEGLYGASIVSVSIMGDGESSDEEEFETHLYNTSGNITYTFYATDSRGHTNTTTAILPIAAANKPLITAFAVSRIEGAANSIKVTISCEIDSLGGYNYFDTDDCIITYAPKGAAIVGSNNVPVTGTSYSTTDDTTLITYTFSTATAYDFNAYIKDSRYTVTALSSIMADHVAMYLHSSNYGAAIGKLAHGTQASPMFEVLYPAEFDTSVVVVGDIECDDMSGDGANISDTIGKFLLNSDMTKKPFRFAAYGGSGETGYWTFEKG